ncbi:MerR family transcriptional regulator [Epidermidibacterium keratini]|uniref:MerR family transcriptional regulator n=1 Tax=Epidermidibacterium keratini TaxID=1891644 RepID=A0A7L4YQ86_9ACTN|nr:MerR family transcriptional regulator [Epidermidibacterium keratini]QHC01238.1 MerR family transcriptional regulator [Epidermidibacterium keratini]
MAELSRSAGVPVATVKYYLREGLLPAGERTSANQAQYDDAHVRRLRLIKALSEYGGISLGGIRHIIGKIDDGVPLGEVLGAVEFELAGGQQDTESPSQQWARTLVENVVAEQRWDLDPAGGQFARTVAVLAAARDAGHGELLEQLLPIYAAHATTIAQADVESVSGGQTTDDVVEGAVAGIVLGGAMLLGLRELAHEAVTHATGLADRDNPTSRQTPAARGRRRG